jgi:drug/metabolite transporter (DMT)-like permease
VKSKNFFGHLLALITIVIWGTTFVSTKVLLKEFSPSEIMIIRLIIALVIMVVIYPKNIGILPLKEELIFCLLGITGISFYFYTENLALQYTSASNVSLIISSIPIITAVIAHFTSKDEKISISLIWGFIIAMIGITIIIFNGKIMNFNPFGDFWAILSAILFSVYSIIVKKVDSKYNQLFVVRKTFFYGLVTALPFSMFQGFSIATLSKFSVSIISNILFLAVFGSVLGFIMWNKAVNTIGAIKTANYIYFIPLVTMITSIIILSEKISFLMVVGGVLIFIGVYLNEGNFLKNNGRFNRGTVKNKTKKNIA